MRHQPLISVVIPTYNRAEQVKNALNCVLKQTYKEFEVIVVDDGSTDGTADALQDYVSAANGNGQEVRYFLQRNQGCSAARNKGIEEARGEWLAFLDSDDTWLPEKLEWQVRAIEQLGTVCGACTTDSKTVNLRGVEATGFLSAGRHYEDEIGIDANAVRNIARSFSNYWISALLARANTIKQTGGFDPQLPFCEDRDFSFRMSLAAPICYVNKLLVEIDRSPSPSGSKVRPWEKNEVRLGAQQFMFEKWLRLDSKLPPDVRRTVVQNLRAVHSDWANWYLETRQYAKARRAASEALKYEITAPLAFKWTLAHLAPALARRITPKVTEYL